MYHFFLRASTDGNCLFSSCSTILFGNEDNARLLRILTAIELFSQPSFYSTHNCFEHFNEMGFCTKDSAFKQSLTNNSLINMTSNIDAVKLTANEILPQEIYVPFIAVLALSSVIGLPVVITTKKLKDTRLSHLYNRSISPRESTNVKSTNLIIHIFWGSTSDTDQLNHFSPFLMTDRFKILTSKKVFIKRVVHVPSTRPKSMIEEIFLSMVRKE